MGGMALVVIGLFVLVWIISAVVKATQTNTPPPRPAQNRQRPVDDNPRVERTTNADIDRFMAEIDRLRNRGEGAPAGRRPEPVGRRPEPARPAQTPTAARPVPTSRPSPIAPPPEPPRARPAGTARKEKERRPRANQRTTASPPSLPTPDPVPVLRPLSVDTQTATPIVPAKPVRPATTAQVGPALPVTAVSQILQDLMRTKQGPAAAVILAEIFSEPPGKRGMVRRPRSHPQG